MQFSLKGEKFARLVGQICSHFFQIATDKFYAIVEIWAIYLQIFFKTSLGFLSKFLVLTWLNEIFGQNFVW